MLTERERDGKEKREDTHKDRTAQKETETSLQRGNYAVKYREQRGGEEKRPGIGIEKK
jgi:hypothetical protein